MTCWEWKSRRGAKCNSSTSRTPRSNPTHPRTFGDVNGDTRLCLSDRFSKLLSSDICAVDLMHWFYKGVVTFCVFSMVGKMSYLTNFLSDSVRTHQWTPFQTLLHLEGYLKLVTCKIVHKAMDSFQETKNRHLVGQLRPSERQSLMAYEICCRQPLESFAFSMPTALNDCYDVFY